ncbi:MAG: hypothetical protein QOJ58_953, partial [Alphaproteobacteria bacterium]|nr:hypothetical protein [Alphaproteobacteria bacterium]
GHLTLSHADLAQIRRYAFHYGKGGWEDRLAAIFGRHLVSVRGHLESMESLVIR